MVSERVLLATSQAATVVTSTSVTTTSTDSADATAASWVQENITGEKPAEDAGIEKAVAATSPRVSGMPENFQPVK
jgi:uncharacterized membrane protein